MNPTADLEIWAALASLDLLEEHERSAFVRLLAHDPAAWLYLHRLGFLGWRATERAGVWWLKLYLSSTKSQSRPPQMGPVWRTCGR